MHGLSCPFIGIVNAAKRCLVLSCLVLWFLERSGDPLLTNHQEVHQHKHGRQQRQHKCM